MVEEGINVLLLQFSNYNCSYIVPYQIYQIVQDFQEFHQLSIDSVYNVAFHFVQIGILENSNVSD